METQLPTTTLIRISKRVGELTNKKDPAKIAKVNFQKLRQEEWEAKKQFVHIFHTQCKTKRIGDTDYQTGCSMTEYLAQYGNELLLADGTIKSL